MKDSISDNESFFGLESFILGLFVNDLLDQYVKVHNVIFEKDLTYHLSSNKQTFHRENLLTLMDIESELTEAKTKLSTLNIPADLQAFSLELGIFIDRLLETIKYLQKIIGEFLSDFSIHQKTMHYNTYKNRYLISRDNHLEQGEKLNTIKNSIEFRSVINKRK